MQYVGQNIDQFWSRWNNYKRDSRKYDQGATCMQQQLFNHFRTSSHCGFLEDISLQVAVRIYSSKQVILKLPQYSQKKTCVGVSFLETSLLKRDFDTDMFL